MVKRQPAPNDYVVSMNKRPETGIVCFPIDSVLRAGRLEMPINGVYPSPTLEGLVLAWDCEATFPN